MSFQAFFKAPLARALLSLKEGKPMNLKSHSLFLLPFAVLLSACTGDGFLAFVEKNCSLGRGETCSSDLPGGTLSLQLPTAEAGQEYYLFLYNNKRVDARDFSTTQFHIQVNQNSAPISIEERDLTEEIRFHYLGQNSLPSPSQINLPAPANILNANFNPTSVLYIPEPRDYGSIDETTGEFSNYYIRESANRALSGRMGSYAKILEEPNKLRVFLSSELQSVSHRYEPGIDCFEEELNWIESALGRLQTRGTSSSVDLRIVPFQQGIGGMFHYLDRFATQGGEPLPDSNLGQNLYVSANLYDSGATSFRSEQFCSTGIHEYQHAYNYDQKVLRGLASLDLNSVRGRQPEHAGLNESYSHFYEELTERSHSVFSHTKNTLSQPNFAPLFLEMAGSGNNLNSRSRGLNHLLLYHALAQKGAALRRDDPIALPYVKSLIDSNEVGLRNIAQSLGWSEWQLMNSFFQHWAMSLYDSNWHAGFIPARENEGGRPQGLRVYPREARAADIPVSDVASFHPLLSEIELLKPGTSIHLRASQIAVYRYIVPENTRPELSVSIMTNGVPYFASFVRVR